MLCHEFKCIFVHVPKTAGQSIEHVFLELTGYNWRTRQHLLLRPNDDPSLGPHRLAHLTATEYVSCGHVAPQQFNEYFKFSFVRNPWARIVSSYKFKGVSAKIDFKTFLFSHMPEPGWTAIYRHFIPQYDYLYDEHGNCLVDFIGKFESLQNNFDQVCRKLGITQRSLPHANKSTENLARTGKHYTDYYDDESRQFVADKYRNDIQSFDYEFGK